MTHLGSISSKYARGFFARLFCQIFVWLFLPDTFACKIWRFLWQMAFGKWRTNLANFYLHNWHKYYWWNLMAFFTPVAVRWWIYAWRTKFGEIDPWATCAFGMHWFHELSQLIELWFQDSTLYCKNLVIPDCVDRTIYCSIPPNQLSEGSVSVNFNPSIYYRKTNGEFILTLYVLNFKMYSMTLHLNFVVVLLSNMI